MIKKRTFKTKIFAKWMRKTELKDQDLLLAVVEMETGLIDSDLGGNVFKKRIALPGMGKRSGGRTLVASKFSRRDGYLCMASQKASKLILIEMNWFICKKLQKDC
jgi:hypothetical protein